MLIILGIVEGFIFRTPNTISEKSFQNNHNPITHPNKKDWFIKVHHLDSALIRWFTKQGSSKHCNSLISYLCCILLTN